MGVPETNWNAHMIALADKAAEQLEGTCKSIDKLQDDEIDAARNDAVFCARLDELIFECETCNWWCEISEMAEGKDWICDECSEEEKD